MLMELETKTHDLSEIAKALAKCQKEIKNPEKDKVNPHFKSKYASLDSVIDAVKGPAEKNGLSYFSTVKSEGGNYFLHTTLLHTSGQSIVDVMPLLMERNSMQKIGSALTYARRYSMQNLFGIVADEDDDGNQSMTKEEKVALDKRKNAEKLEERIKLKNEILEMVMGHLTSNKRAASELFRLLKKNCEKREAYILSKLGDVDLKHDGIDQSYWKGVVDKLKEITEDDVAQATM